MPDFIQTKSQKKNIRGQMGCPNENWLLKLGQMDIPTVKEGKGDATMRELSWKCYES